MKPDLFWEISTSKLDKTCYDELGSTEKDCLKAHPSIKLFFYRRSFFLSAFYITLLL